MDRKTVIEKCMQLYDLLACVKCGMTCSRNYRNGLCEHVICTHCLKSINVWKRICCGVANQGTMATPCKKMFTKDGLIPEMFFNQKFGEMLNVMKVHNVTFEHIGRPKPLSQPKTTGVRKRSATESSSSQELEHARFEGLEGVDLTTACSDSSSSADDAEPQKDLDRPPLVSPRITRFPKAVSSAARMGITYRAGCSTKGSIKQVARRSSCALRKNPTKSDKESVTLSSNDDSSPSPTHRIKEIETSSSCERDASGDNQSPESNKKEAIFKEGLNVTSILPRKSPRLQGRTTVASSTPSKSKKLEIGAKRVEEEKAAEVGRTPTTRQRRRGKGSTMILSSPISQSSSDLPALTIATDNDDSSSSSESSESAESDKE